MSYTYFPIIACPSITIDKHPCDALPILLCPFLCISFFCWCKGTYFSSYQQIVLANNSDYDV